MENNHVITEKANKKLSWKQVTIGGISGVVLGAVSTAAYAGTEKPEEVEEELGSTPVAGVDGQAHVDTVIPVAEVDNALPFAQARRPLPPRRSRGLSMPSPPPAPAARGSPF